MQVRREEKKMYVKVLGSVSPYCKNNCNCPGYLLEKDNNRILLDCGSGITREMSFPKELENLIIVISHLHRDHYGDLLTIGYASYVYHRLGLLKDKIKIYLPKDSSLDSKYLTSMSECFMDFIFYDEKMTIRVADLKISFKRNPHTTPTYSIKVSSFNKSVVYSADTGYQNNVLEEFSKNADLLICETTFLSGQKKSEDNHLTTIEAGMIAKKAQVKKLLITHFWPEIPKTKYKLETKKLFNNTIIAQEGKVIKIGW